MAAGSISLLSSQALVQVPWIKIEIGKYTFGVYSKTESTQKDHQGFFKSVAVQYPNYVQSLNITKINGQVNQYTLNLTYAVTQISDPNFIEKVLSSVSDTRKIIFSYGDMSQPNYIYRNEEAIITKVTSNFDLSQGTIKYTIYATSSAALNASGCFSFPGGTFRPSDKIKEIFKNKRYKLQDLFPGMNSTNIEYLVDGDDMTVSVESKTNMAPIDYINYLVSCMVPNTYTTANTTSSSIYVLTMTDAAEYDNRIVNGKEIVGAYFRVQRVDQSVDQSDAFVIDLGVGNHSNTIVTQFSVDDNENYALIYKYNDPSDEDNYVYRLDNNGSMNLEWSPAVTSKNNDFITRSQDIAWWTKVTQYPIKATIQLQGLLRPAILMTYVRLNVIFVGGRKHIASGLYLVTKQQDSIDSNGYKTTLSLTKIKGDSSILV